MRQADAFYSISMSSIVFLFVVFLSTKPAEGQTCLAKGDACTLCGDRCCDGLLCQPASPFAGPYNLHFCTDDPSRQCVPKGWPCSPNFPASICCQGLHCDPRHIFPSCTECPTDNK